MKPTPQSMLSPHRAFVVQFRDPTDSHPKVWTGRVEHIASGRTLTFASRVQLLAFLADVLWPQGPTTQETSDPHEEDRAPP